MNSESATPRPTAAATGRSRVAANVEMAAIWDIRLVRMMASMAPVRKDPIAAVINTAARVAVTTLPTACENATMMMSIQTPVKIAAHLSRAPAATLRAVCPTDPPTGSPPKRPLSRFPVPWAMKSWFASERVPSRLGADSLTPAPWISTSTATAKAPSTRDTDRSERCGSMGMGRPWGMSPWSLTSCTESAPASSTAALGTISATRDAYGPTLVRPRPPTITSAVAPAARVAVLTLSRLRRRSQAFVRARSPDTSTPRRSGSWPSTMLAATPVRKPIITECGTNLVQRPSLASPARTISAPAISVSRKRARPRVSAGTSCTADPAARAAALVVVMTISLLLEVRPPPSGPKMLAYRP